MAQTPSLGDKESVSVSLKVLRLVRCRRDSKLVSRYKPNGLLLKPHRISKALSKRTHAEVQLACPWAASLVVKRLKYAHTG